MIYDLYAYKNMVLAPANAMADAAYHILTHPFSPSAYTEKGREMAAQFGMVERITRQFQKPEFGIDAVETQDGKHVSITQETMERRTFCHLLHFRRDLEESAPGVTPSHDLPKVLIVAPLSGHYATLLRDTVRAMLQDHDVYITDWVNARDIPFLMGDFDLDDYIDYLIHYMHLLGPELHVMAVCQPSVPLIAATALMNADQDPLSPKSITLMGGPIDTRVNPTAVNLQAKEKSIDWFDENATAFVPFMYPGACRKVCPGFMMLSGFMSMNLERHYAAHKGFYESLIKGDDSSADAHRAFYDEFLAVLDMPAEYYLQSVNTVFQKHALPKGQMRHRGEKVDLKAINKTALMTVEGERDDISGVGQTKAAHDLCPNIPSKRKRHWEQKGAGHYGIFNGRRWREKIMPQVRKFIAEVK